MGRQARMGDEEASDARQLRQGRDFFEATRAAMTFRCIPGQPVTFACDTDGTKVFASCKALSWTFTSLQQQKGIICLSHLAYKYIIKQRHSIPPYFSCQIQILISRHVK